MIVFKMSELRIKSTRRTKVQNENATKNQLMIERRAKVNRRDQNMAALDWLPVSPQNRCKQMK